MSMQRALALAEQALAAGELPIAAVITLDGQVVCQAHTAERALRRYLVHAELLALTAFDECGWSRAERRRCRLFTTLEPCMMCLGAAITAWVGEVVHALESPDDGAAALAAPRPDLPEIFRPPILRGGVGREESRALFARYAAAAKPGGLRDWAAGLAALPTP